MSAPTYLQNAFLAGLFCAVIAICPTVCGNTIYVDANAQGQDDGTSWTDAVNTLQDGLAIAGAGEKPVEIRVAAGVYHPDVGTGLTPGDRSASFALSDGMTLMGGYAGSNEPNAPNHRDPDLFETILSGDLLDNDGDVNTPVELLADPRRSDNSRHVVRCDETESGVLIDGVTITGGCAATPCAQLYAYSGGGLLSAYSTVTLTNVILRNNTAEGDYAQGGGIYASGSITMAGCVLEGNIAYGSRSGDGGGMFCYGQTELENCVFRGNISRCGGGMQSWLTLHATDCLFTANTAILLEPDTSGVTAGGGGMYMQQSYEGSSLTRCVFSDNSAVSGGGLRTNEAQPVITNCLFAGNSAVGDGGGIQCDTYPCDIEFINCTFADNTAGEYGGGFYAGYEANPHVINCILWGNIASLGSQIATRGDSLVRLDYTDLEGGPAATASCDDPEDPAHIIWGVGNIDVDPCFASPADRDYHLKSQVGRYWPEHDVWVLDNRTSACIDAGDPYADPSTEPVPNGDRINLGAYGAASEASHSNRPALIGDLNHDGVVDFKDMAIMADNWLRREVIPPPAGD